MYIQLSMPRLTQACPFTLPPYRSSAITTSTMTPALSSTVDSLFAGGTGILGPEGHRSGIFKKQILSQAAVTLNGITGDEHADKRVHGGPEKAVHHYASENYQRFAAQYPDIAKDFFLGSIGENISTHGLTEKNVHIGDIFRIGSVVAQVSQPRSPCWKIDHRFGVERMSMFVAKEHITGWYYRILEPGFMSAGDKIELLERQPGSFSIDDFWKIQLSHRPALDELIALAAAPGLAADWQRRLTERAKWMQKAGNVDSTT
ncbi:MOSC domain-containing protein [Azohydromonas lata]|uniref:MOSC domain-containing protein n=1 Tax=Azohydromonas lata TaxID=45677 RepID=A0ABU5IMR9_9BURK|nr:MOSC domain-containing protein [Azohydromonas lata]MDZ5460198.1 MOSC domain-containing protein [Azohydromonas lata]